MTPDADWRRLQSDLDGAVALPGTPDYERLRRPAVAGFTEPRPRAVVRCATARDVARATRFAGRHDLSVAARSGGHCFAGRSANAELIVDVADLDALSLADGLVTVGAGSTLGRLYDALDPEGLTIPAGCGPTVGIAGLTLGGGLGVLGRRYGLTCDRLRRASVVLADGTLAICDSDSNADLLWALRGAGGGQFGIVTALTFEPVPAPAMATFHLTWPIDAAPAVVDRWQHWAPAAPDELAASLLLTVPANIEQPVIVHVFGALTGDRRTATDLIAGLATVTPTTAAFHESGHREAKRYLDQLGQRIGVGAHAHGARLVATSRSEFFSDPLPFEAIGALVDHAVHARVPGQARELDCTPWAGSYTKVPVGDTAFAHRDAHFLVKHTVAVDATSSDRERTAASDWLDRSWSLLHPYGTGGVYPNFPDPKLTNPMVAYHGPNHDRLARVKAAYDPTELFGFHQSITVASMRN